MIKCKGKFSKETFIIDGNKLICSDEAREYIEEYERKHRNQVLMYDGMACCTKDWFANEKTIWVLLNNIDAIQLIEGEIPLNYESVEGKVY